MLKKVLIGLLVILVIMQFFRPERNISATAGPNDIRVSNPVPANVLSVLKRACFDCHSNNTNYPWYTNIQPVGWWMQHHVDEGKEELNFSEFATYSAKKAAHKLEETAEMVEEKEMPLESYTWIHKNAKLTQDEIKLVADWAMSLKAQIENQ